MVYIYILELQDNHYYVGKSDSPARRIEDHTSGNGSYWCKKYGPIIGVETFPDCNDFEEDKKVKELMLKYGIDKIRGGTYVQTKLTAAEIAFITKELQGATDVCWKCGEKGHFIKQCPTTNKKVLCQRCNRNTHTAEKCYAKTKRDGTPIISSFSSDFYNESNNIWCSRCGRSNHISDKCYAKIHMNGTILNKDTDCCIS